MNQSVTRAYAQDTLVDTVEIVLPRRMYFLQAGEVTKPYAGWVLWGFRGMGWEAPWVIVKGEDGSEFFGNQALYDDSLRGVSGAGHFVRLAKMDTVIAGSRLFISVASDTLHSHLISDYDSTGTFARAATRYYRDGYFDSLSFVTPATNPRQYNQFMVQTFPGRSIFVVPYILK